MHTHQSVGVRVAEPSKRLVDYNITALGADSSQPLRTIKSHRWWLATPTNEACCTMLDDVSPSPDYYYTVTN